MGKVKIRGIFATWTVADVARSPEMVLRLNLERNPTHPFVPLSESSNKLILRMRSQQIVIGIITLLMAGAVAVALYYTQGTDSLRGGGSSIFSVPAFIAAWGLALMIFNVQVRIYIIDHVNGTYEFYRGSTLVYRGKLHNVYVRLRPQSTGAGEVFYDIVFNGFMLEQIVLSGKSSDQGIMDRLTKRLAHRLHINYFDLTSKSRTHVVRHRCPYKLLALSDTSSTSTVFSV